MEFYCKIKVFPPLFPATSQNLQFSFRVWFVFSALTSLASWTFSLPRTAGQNSGLPSPTWTPARCSPTGPGTSASGHRRSQPAEGTEILLGDFQISWILDTIRHTGEKTTLFWVVSLMASVPVRNNEIIKRSSKSGTTATTSESNEEKCDDLNLSNETETANIKMKHFPTRRQASDSNLLKKAKYLEFSRWEFSLIFPTDFLV